MPPNPPQPTAPSRKAINPFYVLLGVLGAALVVTGIAYGMMMYQASLPAGEGAEHADHPLFQLMSAYGNTLLVIELVLLAIVAYVAVKTDDSWERRAANIQAIQSEERETDESST